MHALPEAIVEVSSFQAVLVKTSAFQCSICPLTPSKPVHCVYFAIIPAILAHACPQTLRNIDRNKRNLRAIQKQEQHGVKSPKVHAALGGTQSCWSCPVPIRTADPVWRWARDCSTKHGGEERRDGSTPEFVHHPRHGVTPTPPPLRRKAPFHRPSSPMILLVVAPNGECRPILSLRNRPLFTSFDRNRRYGVRNNAFHGNS